MKPDRALIDWLAGPSRELSRPELLTELVARLEDAGVGPLVRVHIGGATMHPEVYAHIVEWTPAGAREDRIPHAAMDGGRMLTNSPIGMLLASDRDLLRIDLTGPDADRFQLTQRIRDAGATEYVLFALIRYDNGGSVISLATSQPGGFTDDQMAFLHGVMPFLRLRVEVEQTSDVMRQLLRTYLGHNASARVLEGAFRRGRGERLRAVVWMSDLRDFTGRTDREPVEVLLGALDEYFTAVAEPIGSHGGEVLKYVGDAVLGVFLLGDDPAATCDQALCAAMEAFRRMDAVNASRSERGLDALHFGLALHVGEVMYGNIGTEGRLDFTVIGKPVNEVSRVESLCKSLGVPLLLTGDFVHAASHPDVRSLGRHALRGVRETPEIYTHQRFVPDAQ